MADRTWQTAIDITPQDQTTLTASGKSMFWFLVEALLGNAGAGFTQGLWTCYYSCDSSVAGSANDGVDRIGSTYNATKIVRATAGSAHSWIVLKSPATMGRLGNEQYYLTLSYEGSYDYGAVMALSKAAPTGGTTTARPTATDEIAVTVGGMLPFTTNANFRITMQLATSGDWWIGGAKNGSGLMNSFIACLSLMAPVGGFGNDYFAVVLIVGYSSITPGGMGYNNSIYSRNAANSGAGVPVMIGPVSGGGGAIVLTLILLGGDALNASSPRYPIYIFENTSSNYAFRGRLPDMMWGCRNQQPGFAAGALMPQCLLGDMWLPLTQVPLL